MGVLDAKSVTNLRHASERAARGGQVAGNALVAAVCAGALAPVVAADAGLSQLSAAVVGLVGSVGANVLSERIGAALEALRGRDESGKGLSTAAVERALTDAVRKTLAEGGPAGAVMRELAAAILRESGAVQAVLEGAHSGGPQAVETMAVALAELGQQYAEFAGMAAEVRTVTRSLERELVRAAAERRAGAQRDQETSLLLGRVLEALEHQPEYGSAQSGATVWAGCPYQGLAPFDLREARVFYGRSQMTRRLVRTVATRASTGGLIVVLGASGAGKSSLLRAGLRPALAQGALGPGSERWPVRVMNPGEDPLGELSALLAELTGNDADHVSRMLERSPGRARNLVAGALAAHTRDADDGRAVFVLVVDQFEEVFALGADQIRREAFLASVEALAAQTPRAKVTSVVVAAVRGDYLDQAATSPVIAEAVSDGPFVVGTMTRAELRQAIQGPAAEAGVRVDPALVEAIVQDAFGTTVGRSGSGMLPLVSLAMANTWRRRRGRGLTLRAYRQAGGLADAVDRSAQEVFDGLDLAGKKAARAMFLALTRVGADGRVTRRTATRDELYTAARVGADSGDAVIESFVERRLLVAESEGVQICHDVLLEAWHLLAEWLGGDATDRALYSKVREDADDWVAGRRDPYRSRELTALSTAAARWDMNRERYPPLSESAERFLAASRRAVRRSARLRVAVACVLSTLVVLSASLAFAARRDADRATAENTIALSRQLAAEAVSNVEAHPVLAGQLAVAAWQVAHTNQADAALSSVVESDWEKGQIPASEQLVTTVAFSPSGQMLADGSEDGTVRVWNPTTGTAMGHIMRDSTVVYAGGGVSSVAFSPDGRELAVGSGDGAVRIWNPTTGTALGKPIQDSTRGVSSVAYSPDGHLLTVGSADGAVRLWNPTTRTALGAPLQDITSRDGPVLSVAFSHDGRVLAVGSADGAVRLWNPSTRIALAKPIQSRTAAVTSVAFGSSRRLAIGFGDGTVRLCDPKTCTAADSAVRAHSDEVTSVSFSPNGSVLATGSRDGTVRLWDAETGLAVGQPIEDDSLSGDGGVRSVQFSPSGNALAVGSGDGLVRMWNPATTTALGAPLRDTASISAFFDLSMAFSPDGTILAVGSVDGAVRLWKPTTRTPLRPPLQDIPGSDGSVTSVAMRPDGRMMAVGATNGLVRLWNPATGTPVGKPLGHQVAAGRLAQLSVAFAPDGQTLAISTDDGTVTLWNATTGTAMGRPLIDVPGTGDGQDHGDFGVSLAFSPVGNTLAVGTSDGNVRLWNAETGTEIGQPLQGSLSANGTMSTVAFSQTGRVLAASSGDGTVRLWNPSTHSEVGQPLNDAIDNTGGITSLAFSPDGRTLASGTHDGMVQLWNLATDTAQGQPLQTTTGRGGGVNALAFSPDGQRLAIGAGDGTVQLLPPALLTNLFQDLCAAVGDPDNATWQAEAPGQPEPAPCGNTVLGPGSWTPQILEGHVSQ